MTFKDLFTFNKTFYKIKLDDNKPEKKVASESDDTSEAEAMISVENRDEWHQEYELIYLSYVLER